MDAGSMSPLHGVLVVDKPLGMSSAAVVAIVRRRAGDARTGHAGTLDPLATGVLVLALGKATKSIERFMAGEKRYRSIIDLSAFTSTDDAEGERSSIECPTPPAPPTLHAVEAALRGGFTGTFLQRPPAFSAVKVAGRRAYKMARAGETPEIEPRPVTVHELQLVRYEWPLAEVDIRCGKGFYVRSLARDLGQALGTGGFCASIRRTAVGPFTLARALSMEALPERIAQSDLIATEAALQMLEAAATDEGNAAAAS